MRTSNPDRLTAATAEQLLDGGPGPAGLQQLLAAAAGPGTASELTGETAALAAFLAAPRETTLPSAPIRRPSMLSTALSKILAAKALAAVVLVAGATGGVALAANASSAPSSPTDETSTTATADADPTAGSDAGSDVDDATKAPTPEPSIIGLCRAWAAGAGDNPGKAAENPAFRSLLEAAGSEKDVAGFCAVRESVDEPGKSGTAPGQADKGQDAPTDDATNGGKGGKPTAAPGNPDHPTGPPADRGRQNRDGADGAENGGNGNGNGNGEDNGKDSDAKDGDAEDSGSRGGGERSEQGGQGRGASEEHRRDG